MRHERSYSRLLSVRKCVFDTFLQRIACKDKEAFKKQVNRISQLISYFLTMAVSVPHTKLGEFDVWMVKKTKILGFNPHSGHLAIRRYDALR